MNFSVAKDFIDYLLTSGNKRFSEAVILEFIGGEPFLEVELIDRICDYFKLSAYKLDHPWYWNYRISICTNGVNYSSESVQKFIAKNFNKISVSITLDGTKEKHDLQRVFPDGTGSYDITSKNVDLWLSQFSGSTKVTFASDDLPFLKDSIISLWNRGIKTVNSNVVFENVWKEGDDKVLEDQLVELADYVLDNELYNKD
jgi:radical SAM peptide maturase (CXXX-repeat target family)